LQRNRHTDIWLKIATSFHQFYTDDPRVLLQTGGWDVLRIQTILQKEQRQHFPYLSGPKLSNYWIFILSQFTDAMFTNMHELSIIPDSHVLQSTVKLGILPSQGTPENTAAAWKELLTGTELTPVDMHPVLWNWSRGGFVPEV
jgi:hypothetical protein